MTMDTTDTALAEAFRQDGRWDPASAELAVTAARILNTHGEDPYTAGVALADWLAAREPLTAAMLGRGCLHVMAAGYLRARIAEANEIGRKPDGAGQMRIDTQRLRARTDPSGRPPIMVGGGP